MPDVTLERQTIRWEVTSTCIVLRSSAATHQVDDPCGSAHDGSRAASADTAHMLAGVDPKEAVEAISEADCPGFGKKTGYLR